jgi:hypothetical protein
LKRTLNDHCVHAFDVYDDELTGICRVPEQAQSIFHNFDIPSLDEGSPICPTYPENEVERILSDLIPKIRSSRITTGCDA